MKTGEGQACGTHRWEEKCMKIMGLNMSVDSADGRITLGYRKSSVRRLIGFSWLRMWASNIMM